jgi:iron complex transport system substrate-binding protein
LAKFLTWLWLLVVLFHVPAWSENNSANGRVAPRLVSLAPSNTELIYSLKGEKSLVGRCNQCDYPEQCRSLEVLGSFTSANAEKLARVKPDHILTVNGQEPVTNSLRHLGFTVTEINNSKLKNIAGNLRVLGSLTGTASRANQLAGSFERSLQNLSAIVASSKSQPTIFFCIWPSPLLTVGESSFLNDCITVCGGKNIAADLKTPYPHYSLESLIVKNPDVIVLPYESRTQHLESRSPWSSLKAFRDKKVFYLPEAKSDMLARPTLRITHGLAWLASKLHPDAAQRLQEWDRLNLL